MPEMMEIDIFIGALKPGIENHVLDKNPATLNEAVQVAANSSAHKRKSQG